MGELLLVEIKRSTNVQTLVWRETERKLNSRLEMASMTAPTSTYSGYCHKKNHSKNRNSFGRPRILFSHQQNDKNSHDETTDQIPRSGKRPEYLGVQKNQAALSLCPATKNCVSTSEDVSDLIHYAPPWNYNGSREKPVSKEVAIEELLQVIESTKPDRFTPRIAEKTDDYVHVEYQSPILGLVDDVEFWFPPGNNSIVEYRSASRLGNFDFDYNRKRIKTLRLELEKKGWTSAESF
ncbi:uncharacterized protein LOC105643114 isoform X3 [Jatropha curcas]|uniref:uncharacterized protein LOC105643114 isoform X3 n=1 Tax=Jatropha curcas TaxID=180498 RepID=UPI0009D680DB|nr:uncharacterized protein LOC105643114 isoform X3 [Jatropha curcas]